MKTIFLKYYVTAFYFCSTFMAFAQPGTNDDSSGLEGTETPAAPIDGSILVLALIGIAYVFLKTRAFALKENTPKE